jgi:hypothetical protein
MGNLDPRAPFPAPVKGGQVAFSRWPLLRTARARGTLQERYLRCRVEVAIAGNLKNGVSTVARARDHSEYGQRCDLARHSRSPATRSPACFLSDISGWHDGALYPLAGGSGCWPHDGAVAGGAVAEFPL